MCIKILENYTQHFWQLCAQLLQIVRKLCIPYTRLYTFLVRKHKNNILKLIQIYSA